jgi:hypothetical protein
MVDISIWSYRPWSFRGLCGALSGRSALVLMSLCNRRTLTAHNRTEYVGLRALDYGPHLPYS